MKVSRISSADFMRGGANQKNLEWQAVAHNPGVNGLDALDVAIELADFDDNVIFPSLQFLANQTGLTTTASIAGLWSLREAGHIDLQMIDGEQFSCRRLLINGGQA